MDSFITKYLERIKYEGSLEPSYETLYGIHVGHALNIPFENLDVCDRKPVLLDPDTLFHKIVENGRGGYCFEMNGLLSAVLKKLGFQVTDVLARACLGGEVFFAKLHHVMLVELGNQTWLVDVGFGGEGITAPVLLEVGTEQKQFVNTYRIVTHPSFGYVLQRKKDGEYINIYAFNMEGCIPIDCVVANHFTATFPESLFLKEKFCTIPTKEGRITLTEGHFKIIEGDKVTETKLSDSKEFNQLLEQYFGIAAE
ncbi:MAG TPA: arylamine N-acetyltransferase [Clostridiales bacterium]|nr:arylamine N-acetyltransferase [Clostridiales bacterium]